MKRVVAVLRLAAWCGFTLAWFLSINRAIAQQTAGRPYKAGDRVAFVGNSITQAGGYQHFIYVYYITRYPHDRITFYNCGVGGDVASDVLGRLHEDVFSWQPTHINVMLGMNDVNRMLYEKAISPENGIEKRRKAALDRYARDIELLVQRLKSQTSHITLIKPSVYDDKAELEEEHRHGVNDALKWCGDHLESVSQRQRTGLTDFWTIMNTINESAQQKDSRFTIVGGDRVHPGVVGHFIMAYQFLKTQSVDRYVSRIDIDLVDGSHIETQNCHIEDFESTDSTVSFRYLERSLPYPMEKAAYEGLRHVPFVEDLNQQRIAVNGIKHGDYELRIDNRTVGRFSAMQLAAGINLAELDGTPQAEQSKLVLKAALDLKAIQAKLRLLKRVEYRDLPRAMWKMPIDSLKGYFESLLQTKYADRTDFATKLFEDYRINKPREKALIQEMKKKEEEIYKLNIPVYHRITICSSVKDKRLY